MMDGIEATKLGVTEGPGGMRIKRVNGALGAEIQGVDLAQPLDAATAEAIKQALSEHL